jgi:Glycoside-hydrolase family GH114
MARIADAPRARSSCACAALATLAACGGGGGAAGVDAALADANGNAPDSSGDAPDARAGALVLPPANAGLDYQLGGAYAPPGGVQIVSRDRTAAPAAGLYSICYVNGFQIQPGEEAWWKANHGDLILKDAGGTPVIDPDWNEMLIDVSTPAKRTAVASIVGDWIHQCVQTGFEAIEIDNLDSYSRSQGLLTMDDAVAAMRLFANAAHADGVPIAQKNSSELVGRKADMTTDFVVAEECNRYDECGTYTASYGAHVLVIEYRQADFDLGCKNFPQLSIVLRDLALVPLGQPGYVYAGC